MKSNIKISTEFEALPPPPSPLEKRRFRSKGPVIIFSPGRGGGGGGGGGHQIILRVSLGFQGDPSSLTGCTCKVGLQKIHCK